MEKTNITPFQLFCMMVIAGLGSSSVLGVGMGAKQDAWITSILGMIGGLLLFLIYYYIFKQYPNHNFCKVMEKLFGKLIGKLISLIYIGHFILIATLVERDIGEMLKLYVLPETPIYLSQLIGLVVVGYAVYLGIEVMGRFNELSFYLAVGLFVLFVLLTIGSGIIKIDNLFPILEQGWKPILKTTFPLTLAFPYSELFVFIMIFPNVNKKSKIASRGILAYVFVGFVLTIINVVNIFVLGPYLSEKALFPTLLTTRLIAIGELVQRLDALAVILLMVCGGVKVAVYLYAICIGIDAVFETKSYRRYIIPGIIAINFLTFIIAKNQSRHIDFGLNIVPTYFNLPIEIIFPILIACYIFVRKRLNII
ncbi:GerAB/ArcD/ProY family transporter [Haloplasma contractile]|uniref:Spore germination protein KB n=1 Tax=Haloplasma contractile SSD-17B TaxID=1033810 RepID=U2DSU8_9MOLU|nr:endospore germination permease [Haloplasma contractile]ERJ11567.1 Spore germination protein KB [Haloplasma contractile SSD-17B]